MHLIPDVDFSSHNFDHFIAARQQLILERMAELLEVDLEVQSERRGVLRVTNVRRTS